MNRLAELQKQTKLLSLLYIEDDPTSREQLVIILELLFGSVTVACDGQEGWEAYQKGTFDLVLTDINMPRMDGIEMSRKIKERNPMQKVIIISAHDSGDYLLSAIRIGVDNFLLKPLENEQFELVMQKAATAIHNEKLQHTYQEHLEQEVAEKTKELLRKAITDDLTGLYNRNKLNKELVEPGSKVLMLLNIDNFEHINATYGYGIGDVILKQIAHFLAEQLPQNATLYRLGYDEFAYLFTQMSLADAEAYAKTLQAAIMQEPIAYESNVVKFTATIVLAEGEQDLLRDAHIAFTETRQIGKNRIGIFHPDSQLCQHQKKIQHCMHVLSNVLRTRQVVPYFQPIIDNRTGKVAKFECLARILHNNAVMTPVVFLETAELTGMLPDVTRLMVEKSFDYFKTRTEEFSINISEYDLNDGYLEGFLQENIDCFGIDPSRVVLEVLEGISAHGAQKSLDQLIRFKQMGFQLAIDDFGAENSNFERVHRLQVDYIKIDGSFIKHIDEDMNSYRVAKTIADFSKSIGAKVIAEYVHSEAVQNKIMELGIEYSQGYYFAEPAPEV
jgi:diguanylate cyclase (GGDEF)-like protein